MYNKRSRHRRRLKRHHIVHTVEVHYG
jgi:hypothetical protein